MRVVGKSPAQRFDADLLVRLKEMRNNSSAKTVTKTEVKSAIAQSVREMKNEFDCSRSTRGLTAMLQAVTNTLNEAVADGWIKSKTAKAEVEAFLTGDLGDHGSLEHVEHFIRDTVAHYKENNPRPSRRSSYGT